MGNRGANELSWAKYSLLVAKLFFKALMADQISVIFLFQHLIADISTLETAWKNISLCDVNFLWQRLLSSN
jgi:hypothetical protein